MDFIPGKKYTQSNRAHTFIGYSSHKQRVWENRYGIIWQEMDDTPWKEYKEPVEHKCYVNFVRRLNGEVSKVLTLDKPLTQKSMESGHVLLNTQEVKYTEKGVE